MVFCKNCEYEGAYISKNCPVCKQELSFDERELREIRESISKAKLNKEYETVAEGYHILADSGDTEGETEWAKILERSAASNPKNIDLAMDFYRRTAEKFDAFGAYKYSFLLSRINGELSDFWLRFSAFLDYQRAYLDTAKTYDRSGENDFRNHYAYLAAVSDDIDAIIFLAEKYYKGDGIEKSPEYAKWYMEKLSFPPLHAFKLSLKLRSAKAKEAPNISIRDRRTLALSLLGRARRLGLSHPIFYLTAYLFEKGDMNAGAELGEMYLLGLGTKESAEEGIRCLSRAAASGNARAYMTLGRVYYEGEHAERNIKFSLECFENAAKLGLAEAHELLGDIYHSSDFEGWSIETALENYKKAADGGSAGARKKADKIIEIREDFYKKAIETEKTNAEESFKYRFAGATMGHIPSKLLLAEAYARGIGTKQHRAKAYELWKSAADADCDRAYFPLGLCYAYGFGTKFDFDLAIKTLAIADNRQNEKARGEIQRLIGNKKRAYAKKFYSSAMHLIYKGRFDAAKGYLEAAEKLSYPKAIYTLGCLYEFGKGTSPDKNEAYRLYALADKAGFCDIRSKYKLTVLKMLKR